MAYIFVILFIVKGEMRQFGAFHPVTTKTCVINASLNL